jgi:hypothetical protein
LGKKSGFKDKFRQFSFEQKIFVGNTQPPSHVREKKIPLMTKWALFDLLFADQGELYVNGGGRY